MPPSYIMKKNKILNAVRFEHLKKRISRKISLLGKLFEGPTDIEGARAALADFVACDIDCLVWKHLDRRVFECIAFRAAVRVWGDLSAFAKGGGSSSSFWGRMRAVEINLPDPWDIWEGYSAAWDVSLFGVDTSEAQKLMAGGCSDNPAEFFRGMAKKKLTCSGSSPSMPAGAEESPDLVMNEETKKTSSAVVSRLCPKRPLASVVLYKGTELQLLQECEVLQGIKDCRHNVKELHAMGLPESVRVKQLIEAQDVALTALFARLDEFAEEKGK